MIASKTIQDNGDRTYNVSFGLLSRNEENDKIEGFRDLKWRKGAQNRNLREKLSKIGPVEKFWLFGKKSMPSQRSMLRINGQRMMCANAGRWRRLMMWQDDVIDDVECWRRVMT